mgnify:CR=1 FL=1
MAQLVQEYYTLDKGHVRRLVLELQEEERVSIVEGRIGTIRENVGSGF